MHPSRLVASALALVLACAAALTPMVASAADLSGSAGLHVGITGPNRVTPGATATYVIQVSNDGPADATGVVLAVPAPAGLSFLAGGGGCATYPCALGSLGAGQTVVTTVAYGIPAGYAGPDPIVLQASVSSPTPDASPADDIARASSAIASPVTELVLTLTSDRSSPVPGSPLSYTVSVVNQGPSGATGAAISTRLPAELEGATWTCAGIAGGICETPSGSGDLDVTASIAVGGSVTFTVAGTVAADAEGSLVAVAAAEPGPGQADPTSASMTRVLELAPAAGLQLVANQPAGIAPGATGTITFTLTGTGPSVARDVVLDLALPEDDLELVSLGSPCGDGLPCRLGDLLPGESASVTATLRVAEGVTAATVPISPEVTSATPDGGSSIPATIDLAVDQSADLAGIIRFAPADGDGPLPSAVTGQSIRIIARVANRGPNPVGDVVMSVPVPDGFAATGSSAPGSYDEATGAWQVGALAVDDEAELVITGAATRSGLVSARIDRTSADRSDPNGPNDSLVTTLPVLVGATISLAAGQPEFVSGVPVSFAVRLDEAVTGLDTDDALPSAGASVLDVTGSGRDWRVRILPGPDGPVGFVLRPVGASGPTGAAIAPAESPVVVSDTIAPVLDGPDGPVEVVAEPGDDSAVIDFEVVASDAGSGFAGGAAEAPAECVPASGSAFPVGTTDVECTATDRAGNVGRLAFPVVVTATPDPTGGDAPPADAELQGTGVPALPLVATALLLALAGAGALLLARRRA